ncbi:MAG: hypothetical protein NVS1B7_8520 [Candidatus Saccharimonadales bacterium]
MHMKTIESEPQHSEPTSARPRAAEALDKPEQRRPYLSKKQVLTFLGALGIVGIATGGLSLVFKRQADESANKVLTTRLLDYGFTAPTASESFGKVRVHEAGHEVDVVCSNLPKDVVGFGVNNNGPNNISFTLGAPMDKHGNPTSDGVSYHVGNPNEVQSFLKEVPVMCASVEKSLHIRP